MKVFRKVTECVLTDDDGQNKIYKTIWRDLKLTEIKLSMTRPRPISKRNLQ